MIINTITGLFGKKKAPKKAPVAGPKPGAPGKGPTPTGGIDPMQALAAMQAPGKAPKKQGLFMKILSFLPKLLGMGGGKPQQGNNPLAALAAMGGGGGQNPLAALAGAQ